MCDNGYFFSSNHNTKENIKQGKPDHTQDMCHFVPSIQECKQGENDARILW